MNNTISYINNPNSSISMKKDFFDRNNFLRNFNFFKKKTFKYHYKDSIFIKLFSQMNDSYKEKKNIFYIFCYFIFFLILGLISTNKKLFKIYLKFKNIFKFILGKKKILIKNNLNLIYALMYVRLVLIYFKNNLK